MDQAYREEVLACFPGLRDFRLTSSRTSRYNCVAWAASDETRWWWPDPKGRDYWPPGAALEETLSAFLQAFRTIGYERCVNGTLVLGVEKVAFYEKDGLITHTARQLTTGEWTSKLGKFGNISHQLDEVEGEDYGKIIAFIARPTRTA